MNSHKACADCGVTKRLEWQLVPRLARLMARILRWQQLARERRQLAMLSDAALKDLGLNRGEILREVDRPFWHDPLGK